jgi:hypothetical protein
MNKDNEKKKDYSKYLMYAVGLAVVCYFFLNILAKIGMVLLKLIIQYWWGALVIALVVLFIKKKGKKK